MQLRQEKRIPAAPAHQAASVQSYPTTDYFQSHFEHLYEVIGYLQQHLLDTHQRMALLQQRLDSLAHQMERDAI